MKWLFKLPLRVISAKQNFTQLRNVSSSLFTKQRRTSLCQISRSRTHHVATVSFGTDFLEDHVTAQRIEEQSKTFPYAIHQAQFTTCAELYLHLIAKGEDRPLTGVTFNAHYVDTHPEADPRKPTVLALHGTPGTHLDFKELVEFLDSKGVRVIVPDFPGFGFTPIDKGRYFTHTAAEKAAFVGDFLNLIRVPKVDLVVVHSAGVYPGLILASMMKSTQAMFMMNPGSLQRTETLRPKWLFQMTAKGYRNSLFRMLTLVVIKMLLVLSGYGNTNAHQMSVAFETLINVNFDLSRQQALKLAIAKFKMALIYSKNDRVVTLQQFEEYVDILGGKNKQIKSYDLDGKLTESSNADSNFEAHRFEGGGHFVMKKYPATVNNIVYNFLKEIRPELQ